MLRKMDIATSSFKIKHFLKKQWQLQKTPPETMLKSDWIVFAPK